MTTLFIAQDVTGAAEAGGKGQASSAAPQLPGTPSNTGSGACRVISCISEKDTTRLRTVVGRGGYNAYVTPPKQFSNDWLNANICSQLNLDKIITLQGQEKTLTPINPAAGTQTSAAPASKPAATAAKAVTADPVVKQVQQALLKQSCAGCYPGTPDGISGDFTRNAIRAYQNAHGLTVNGDPKDPPTLGRLGVKDEPGRAAI